MTSPWDEAARAVSSAAGILVTAGAGMGVDSGLPDFRGNAGFWRAYPPLERLGLSFAAMADPRWFRDDPLLVWGFYGHRLALYRDTRPHEGFAVLLRWAQRVPSGAFVFTSNVDGQFQRAGFADGRIVECHGAIEWLQCVDACGAGLFPAAGVHVEVDPQSFRARPPLPSCTRCGGLARPAILMFGDAGWDDTRNAVQERALAGWLRALDGPLVVVECGAGTAIPTVRRLGESLLRERSPTKPTTLVRINPREPEGPAGTISLATGARAGLLAIDALVQPG